MSNLSKIIRYVAIPTLCLGLGGIANSAPLDDRGYVFDTQGEVVKDNYGDCVRSTFPQSEVPDACGGEKKKVEPKPPARVERAAPPPAPHVEKTSLEAKALFATNKFVLKPAGKASLDKLAREIKSISGVHEIHVIGHTDSKGSAAYNQRLSEQRARTVKDYLHFKGLRNITAEGRGLREPVASNATESGRAQNRRVEVEVVVE
ncbi:OmpA-OmpF porin, OOP family [Gammaproteobacteria bacterium]